MKKFTRITALLVIAGVLMSSFCVVSATTDGKVQMTRTQVVYENFDNGLTFDAYGAPFTEGTWERFLVADDATDANVSAADGVIKLTSTGEGSAVGFRYAFEQTEKEYFITFKTRRPGGTANLSVQLYHNYDSMYRYGGGIPGLAMANYQSTWVTVGIHIAEGGYITFYSKADGATSFTKLATSSTSNSTITSSKVTSGSWNQLKLFVERDTTVTQYEFDDICIYSIEPDDSDIIFIEDFEGAASNSDLTTRGFTLGYPDKIGVTTEENGNTAATLTGLGTTVNGVVQLDTGTSINNYQLPSIMPEEFYASFRVNMNTGNALAIQLTFNGTMNGANANSNGRETAVRRINLLGAKNLFYAYCYDATAANPNSAYVKCETINPNCVFSPDNGWITMVLHVKGDQYRVYWQDENKITGLTAITDWLTAPYIATNTTATEDVNYLKFYMEKRTGTVLIDDIRIYKPGMRSTGATISAGAQGGLKMEMGIVGSVGTAQPLMGIFALYDDQEMMKAVAITETNLDEVIGGTGKITAAIGQIPDGATNAKVYLWDSLTGLQPLGHWIDFSTLN